MVQYATQVGIAAVFILMMFVIPITGHRATR